MPATLRTAIGLLAVQATAGAALVVLLVYQNLTTQAQSQALAIYVTVFCALYTAAFGFTAAALVKRKMGARGVAIALELLLAAPAYYMITGALTLPGWILAAVIATVTLTLMSPQTSAALS